MSSLENELNAKRDECISEITFEEMIHFKFSEKDKYVRDAFKFFLLKKINICLVFLEKTYRIIKQFY